MLHHEIVGPQDAAQTALVCHGILGSGRNWRGFARVLADRLDGWRFVLVDLRNHGKSLGFEGPHTLDACAGDLQALVQHLGSVQAAVGHSFGGKVVMSWAQQNPRLQQVWVLDAPPESRPADPSGVDALGVIRAVQSIPQPCQSRDHARQQLCALGLSVPLVAWLLTSLKRQPDGWRWVWDLTAIDEMIRDYLQRDFRPWLRHATTRIQLVKASKSDRWNDGHATDYGNKNINFHVLPNAGHWLHVDNPAGLQNMLVTHWHPIPATVR